MSLRMIMARWCSDKESSPFRMRSRRSAPVATSSGSGSVDVAVRSHSSGGTSSAPSDLARVARWRFRSRATFIVMRKSHV